MRQLWPHHAGHAPPSMWQRRFTYRDAAGRGVTVRWGVFNCYDEATWWERLNWTGRMKEGDKAIKTKKRNSLTWLLSASDQRVSEASLMFTSNSVSVSPFCSFCWTYGDWMSFSLRFTWFCVQFFCEVIQLKEPVNPPYPVTFFFFFLPQQVFLNTIAVHCA